MSESSEELQELAKTALIIADEAERIALNHYRQNVNVSFKDDLSPVTVADLAIERKVREMLNDKFPSHVILGEEIKTEDCEDYDDIENLWVVDPIDGTRSFISGHPLFGFLLAYLKGGKNQISLVSMPALGERFMATSDLSQSQATLNGERIAVSSTRDVSKSIMYVNEGNKIFTHEPSLFQKFIGASQTLRFGYDCYPHSLLAAGLIDIVVDYDLKPFDYLPLTGLIEAAGGQITDWDGNKLNANSDGRVLSTATPDLHDQMLKLISK